MSGFVPIVLSLLVLLPLVLLLPLVVSPGAVVLGTIVGFVGDTGFSGNPAR